MSLGRVFAMLLSAWLLSAGVNELLMATDVIPVMWGSLIRYLAIIAGIYILPGSIVVAVVAVVERCRASRRAAPPGPTLLN